MFKFIKYIKSIVLIEYKYKRYVCWSLNIIENVQLGMHAHNRKRLA